jgi:1,3-beta-glucanosyltransferase GAS3
MSRVDIFALNSYSWCGSATFESSGYSGITKNFSSTSVPVFFSEYGCNNVAPRIFTEVQALYGPQMTPVLSGGNVYEYAQEVNNYGLVVINNNGSAQLLPDFDTLRNQYLKLNYTTLQGVKATNTSVTPPVCAPSLISIQFGFNNNFTIPVPPPGAQDLIDNGIPNPNNGKIISITNYQVSQTVQASNGAIITGLAVKPLSDDQSNAPVNDSSTTVSNPSATSSSPSATSSKAAAGTIEITTLRSLMAGILAVFFCL